MPNHCINELVFRNLGLDQVRALRDAVGTPERVIDFEVLLPPPLSSWWGSVGIQHEKAFKITALDWCRENWGTKWNAYGEPTFEHEGDTVTIRFQTAWGPPYGWLAAVLNKLSLSFVHSWLSEGGAPCRVGTFTFDPNNALGMYHWSEKDADEATHRAMHKLLWGVEEFADEGEL